MRNSVVKLRDDERLVATLRRLFGRRLKELRTEKGFNQLYLGTLAGVSEDFISQVERGINTPSFETIEALASALGIDVAALFTFAAKGASGRTRSVSRVSTSGGK